MSLKSDTIVPLFMPYESNPMKIELVTNLKRQATKILADLHVNKEPILITEHGQPSAYLVDVEGFEFMQRRMQILEGIAKGEKAIDEGKTLSHEQAQEKMEKWLK
jgi:prevent-host-death family protein